MGGGNQAKAAFFWLCGTDPPQGSEEIIVKSPCSSAALTTNRLLGNLSPCPGLISFAMN